MEYIIAVDIGTTSAKAVAFSKEFKVISSKSIEYTIYHPQPNWSEQNPDEIFEAILNAIKYVVEENNYKNNKLKAIVFSSAMHSLIPVDRNGIPLYNSIIWADNRSEEYASRLKETKIGKTIYHNTGTPIHSMSPLCKILWLKDNNKDLFNRTYKFISIKEYIFLKLFNEFVVDYSIASATGLFNIYNLKWNNESLDIIGISSEKLSIPVSPLHIIKGLKKEYAEFLNINKDTPFIIGASDGCLANLGCNAIKPSRASVTIGTSGAIRITTNKPVSDKNGRVFSYVLTENYYVVGGSINNGGIALKWFIDNFYNRDNKNNVNETIDELMKKVQNIKPGSDGLICLPYLLGERAPHWDSNARGVYFGINITHTYEHFLRALMEGIIFGLKSIGNILEELTEPINDIFATGGFTNSTLWLKILSDVFNKKVLVSESYESTCLGAAILAMHSLGLLKSLQEIDDIIPVTKTISPNQENYEIYKGLFEIYQRLYDILRNEFMNIVKFQ